MPNKCFMGDCKKLYDQKDPCEDYEAQLGNWGKCHEFQPTEEDASNSNYSESKPKSSPPSDLSIPEFMQDIYDHIEKTGGWYWHGVWKGKGDKPDIICPCPTCSEKRELIFAHKSFMEGG